MPVDGRIWVQRFTPADNNWFAVAWSPERGLFAAVAGTGVGNRVMTSPDGIVWTIRVSAGDNDWRGIAWSPQLNLFAAVSITAGVGNQVMTSPDGITWTMRVSAIDRAWNGIAWSPELGLFAAVANSGVGNRVMTSPDGIVWTARVTPADNNWLGIAWSPQLLLFAAVAETGVLNRVMTSPNGIVWTIRVTPIDNAWRAITWSPELALFAAVSTTGVGNRVMTSPNGIAWTLRVPATDNTWLGIAWSPELGLFAAVAQDGVGDRVMTSPDGIVWTTRRTIDNNWFGIAWSPQRRVFASVAFSGVGSRAMTSATARTVFDEFTRADSDDLGAPWDEQERCGGLCGLLPAFIADTFRIVSNRCEFKGAANDGFIIRPLFGRARWSNPFANDQFAEYNATGFSSQVRQCVGVRMSGTPENFTGYLFSTGGGDFGDPRILWRFVNASLALGANGTILASNALQDVGVYRLEIVGSTLRVFRNGALLLGPVVDVNIAAGQAGLAVIGDVSIAGWPTSSPGILDWLAEGITFPGGKAKKMGGSGAAGLFIAPPRPV